MQALPISQRATDIGQLFAGGGETTTNATGRQAGKPQSQGEVIAGSFLAALTLGEGDGESDGETVPRDGAGFTLSAEQGSKQLRDPQGEGPVVVAVGLADVAERGEVSQVSPTDGSLVPGWRWTEVESGSPKLSLVAGEVDGDIPDRGVPIARSTAEEGRQGTQLEDQVRVVSRMPGRKAIDQLAALPQQSVSPMSTVGGRDFVGTGNGVPGRAPSVDVPIGELSARDALGPRAVEVPVPRTTVALAPTSQVGVTQVPLPPTHLGVVAREVFVAEGDVQHLLLEPPPTVVRGGSSSENLDADVVRGSVAEGMVEVRVSADGAAEADRDGRQSEATAKAPLIEAAPTRRAPLTESYINVARVVGGDESLPEPHTGAGRGEQAEARPATTSLPPESRPEQRERVETTPVEKSPSGREERRASPPEESSPPTQDDAIEKLPHELPVENFTTKGSKLAEVLPEHPQDGKAVENFPATPVAERFTQLKYRVKLGNEDSTEVPTRGHERPVSAEGDAPDWMPSVVVSNASVQAVRRVAEVSSQSSDTQSDDHEVRPGEPEASHTRTGLDSSQKGVARMRSEAVDIEAYRLTMEASRRDEWSQAKALKPLRTKELEEPVPVRTGNPQPVDKKSKWQAAARPTNTSREAWKSQANQAGPLFGTTDESSAEADIEREGSADKRPPESSRQRAERHTAGTIRTDLGSDADVDPAQPRKQVDPAPFAEMGKADLKPQGKRAGAEVPKTDSQTIDTVESKTLGGAESTDSGDPEFEYIAGQSARHARREAGCRYGRPPQASRRDSAARAPRGSERPSNSDEG